MPSGSYSHFSSPVRGPSASPPAPVAIPVVCLVVYDVNSVVGEQLAADAPASMAAITRSRRSSNRAAAIVFLRDFSDMGSRHRSPRYPDQLILSGSSSKSPARRSSGCTLNPGGHGRGGHRMSYKRSFLTSAEGQLQRLGVALRAGLLGFARTDFAVSTLTGSIPDARRRTVSMAPCAQELCRRRLLARFLSGEPRRHRSMLQAADGAKESSGRAYPTNRHGARRPMPSSSYRYAECEIESASRSAPRWLAAVGRCEEAGPSPWALQPRR